MEYNKGYVIFGTGVAAEQAYAYAVSRGLHISYFIDDYKDGEHKGVRIVRWSDFILCQDTFEAILAGKHQKGTLASRTSLRIPLILVDPNMDNDKHIGNLKNITSLKDVSKGEKCFVVGNGPSLTISDLELLKGYKTFASNKIYLAFDQTDWRPDFYFVEDYLVARNNADIINSLNIRKIFESRTREFLNLEDSDICYHFIQSEFCCGFSENIVNGVAQSGTVTGSQLQFARYMGFAEVYLIGLDFSFQVSGESVGRLFNSTEVVRAAGEQNHFHPQYREHGEEWSMPDLKTQQFFYDNLAENIQKESFRVYNASRKTCLSSFVAVSLEDVVLGEQNE